MPAGMYRTPIGSLIETIADTKKEMAEEVNSLVKLLAEHDPETYNRFLKRDYIYTDYITINTSEHVKTEIYNFDFNGIALNVENLSGKSILFIFATGINNDEFELPLEIASNFNYARRWAMERVKRRKQLSSLEKEFRKGNRHGQTINA